MAKPSRTPNAYLGSPRSRSRGGFILGMFVGLIVGLAVALGIAFYLNKTPIPFMTKNPTGGKPVDTGGYYQPDFAKTSAAMRPSATLNAALAAL